MLGNGCTQIHHSRNSKMLCVVIFNARQDEFLNFDGALERVHGLEWSEGTYRIRDTCYKFKIALDSRKNEIKIGEEIYRLQDGAVFLCDIREDCVVVKQLSAGFWEMPMGRFGEEFDILVRDNPTVKKFVEEGVFGEGN